MSRAALRNEVAYDVPSHLGVTVGDDVTDREPMTLQALYDALVDQGCPPWIADGVSEFMTGDSAFLRRQVERHVPGWVRL